MLAHRLNGRWGAALVRLVPFGWLGVFFLLPFLIVLKIALSIKDFGRPPYTPLVEWIDGLTLQISISFDNFALLFSESLYLSAYWSSVKIAFGATLITLLIGYPMAYAIARASEKRRPYLLMAIILPFWTSFLIRVYAWIGILKDQGLLNELLMALGLISEPLHILYTPLAVQIGIVYSYLPFMILPLYAALERMDHSLLDAAADLGAKPWRAFVSVTLPLSVPGIVAGCMLVFIPAVGEFVIPDLLGGSDTLMIGKVLWNEFSRNVDWPMASALAILMLLALVVPAGILQALRKEETVR